MRGFSHPALAKLPSYPEFRRLLADLADESDAPLGRFLGDVRMAALSSPFGSSCPAGCGTRWPVSAQVYERKTFHAWYSCECGQRWAARNDIDGVNWPNE
ncbi:hypothetical protein [Agromyces badenianii]|uniref:hypothetical protein n=1 Tax=Agromyces badenianii TaxID=2080742 RepID=UPI000D598556|nr:hypothetical protein [Agromyces badenianii]PWC04260.1 hypothetical protein DCE94_08890 [Agromyces badenianii]